MWFPESQITKRFSFLRNLVEMKLKDSQVLMKKLPSTMKQAKNILSGGQQSGEKN
jgi:hypothetical protein